MGYQALLFCPDEKLARIVSQVFTELDFSIEHVQEPFGAVKRLMAQHYDAVVVDCENETNAALLFKSARNSSSNQSSLAIAVVEGQAGVAKAYRIGANLVLTKPIKVEQAKGTLRVARGLLRKTADAVAATNVNPPTASAAPVAALLLPASVPANAVSPNVEPITPPANQSALPEFETPLPAMAASAEVEESPVAAPAREVQAEPPVTAQPSAYGQPRTAPEPAKPKAAPAASKAMESPAASFTTGQGAAAAPAPARQTPAEKKTVEFEAAYQKDDSHSTFGTARIVDGPSFAGLDGENAGAAGSKKILVAAAVVLALAALGYAGWTKLSTSKTRGTSPPVSESQPLPPRATPPTAAPMSVPVTTPATDATNRADANIPVGTSKSSVASGTAPLAAGSSPVLRIDVNSEPETKKTGVARIVVKSAPAKQAPARTEEAAAQLPSPLAVGASSESGLSSLTAPSMRSQPSLAKLNISQGVSQGLLIKRVQPRYPQNALAMHLQGAVQLEATINQEGKIVNLKVLKGDAILARAAMDAVRQWRYKPYYLDGVPVDIETQIAVKFKLPN
jgi:TonB family protein